jgi:hypothetical protein
MKMLMLKSVNCSWYLPLQKNDSTGKGLTDVTHKFLEKTELELKHYCRGLGYDNGANMKGKNSGVLQK